MGNQITVRELTAPEDIARFWEELYAYFRRDVMPDPKDEDRDYFLGPEYRAAIEALHSREKDPLYYLFFQRNGRDIGFTSVVGYLSEDGKFFILDFSVVPNFRGNGTGRACAAALLEWCRRRGAAYFELNADTDRRQRFWHSMGFVLHGADERGVPLMRLPPG